MLSTLTAPFGPVNTWTNQMWPEWYLRSDCNWVTVGRYELGPQLEQSLMARTPIRLTLSKASSFGYNPMGHWERRGYREGGLIHASYVQPGSYSKEVTLRWSLTDH